MLGHKYHPQDGPNIGYIQGVGYRWYIQDVGCRVYVRVLIGRWVPIEEVGVILLPGYVVP